MQNIYKKRQGLPSDHTRLSIISFEYILLIHDIYNFFYSDMGILIDEAKHNGITISTTGGNFGPLMIWWLIHHPLYDKMGNVFTWT